MVEMNRILNHPWDLTFKEAREVQNILARKVKTKKLTGQIKSIAGFDVTYLPDLKLLIAGMVILTYPALKNITTKVNIDKIRFPYITGYLSFREAPPLLQLIQECKHDIDIYLFDGHGIAHPRGLGIASHIGVLINKPTIGCAKKKLVGEYGALESNKGAFSNLVYNNKIIGKVLRTKNNVKPIFISVGNLVILEDIIPIVLNCIDKYRLPEPIRQAHLLVNSYRKKYH
jgi:deoxyribonuclease V